MISRPPHLNAFEFAVVAALRAQQLLAGCTPRLCGEHSATTMAQMEVAEGCVARCGGDVAATPRPDDPVLLKDDPALLKNVNLA